MSDDDIAWVGTIFLILLVWIVFILLNCDVCLWGAA
jgi:hypothetical protein